MKDFIEDHRFEEAEESCNAIRERFASDPDVLAAFEEFYASDFMYIHRYALKELAQIEVELANSEGYKVSSYGLARVLSARR